MQKIAKRKPFRNSEFKLLISRFFGPSLAPPTEPMKPAEVATLLLQGQTDETDKPAPEKSGARK
jgi:hypothetical protein